MAVQPEILFNARLLRTKHTDAERLLWSILRGRRFCGVKFRRQHPFDRFVLDFFCQDFQLAIELDGSGHNEEEQKGYDAERTRFLESAGIRMLRFWNHEVLNDLEAVLEKLHAELFPSPGAAHHPLPAGEGNHWCDALVSPVGMCVPSPSGRRCPQGG